MLDVKSEAIGVAALFNEESFHVDDVYWHIVVLVSKHEYGSFIKSKVSVEGSLIL